MKRYLVLMPILTFGMSLGPLVRATGKDGGDPSCIVPLSVARDLPPNWSFSAGEFARMAAANPDLDFAWLAKLARFIDSPDNLPFFELLGVYNDVGFAADGLWDNHRLEEADHRPVQVYTIMELAAAKGLLPARLDIDQVRFIAEILGPLPFQTLIRREVTANVRMEDVAAWFRGIRLDTPKLMSIVLHSQIAQANLIDGYREMNGVPVDFEAAREALKLRLRGERGHEDPSLTPLLNQISNTLDLSTKRPNGGKAKAAAWKVLHDNAAKLSHIGFGYVLNLGLLMLDRLVDGPHKMAGHNPIGTVALFERSLDEDAFIDQGLSPLLRRAFVELVLKRPTLNGRQIRQRVRAELDLVMRSLRTAWRSIEREDARRSVSAAVPAVGESREERLQAYRESVRVVRDKVTNATSAYGKIGKVIDVTQKTTVEPASDPGPWPRLLNENQSTAKVRQLLPLVISPDTALALDLRSGFRYRVEFANALLKQLTDPAAGEPADPREWLRAMQSGPARATGQNGWKKRSVPVLGLYDWEIKLTGSPYRMLGFKKADGVWRFELIKLMH